MITARRWRFGSGVGIFALAVVVSVVVQGLVVSVGASASTPAEPSWTTAASPNAGVATGRLAAVACPSETDCWAVGNGWPGLAGSATIAHWAGEEWTLVPAPSDPDNLTVLYDAACASETECFAVGSVSNPLDVFTGFVPLHMHSVIYQWDGTSWTLVESPFGDEGSGVGRFSLLRGVDCSGPGDCWAVGAVREGNRMNNLVLHWDGTAWTRADVSESLGDENLVLGSISCPASDFCMAAGPLRDSFVVPSPRATSAAVWDGTQWSVAPSPAGHPLDGSAPASYRYWLGGISCTAADDCWAVGDADVTKDAVTTETTTLPLLSHWDGTAWTNSALPAAPLAAPAAPGGTETHLADVSCVAADDCWAIGHSSNEDTVPGAVTQDFVLRWDGTAWLPAPALPEPDATFGGTLRSIDCPTASRCWAVGQITPSDQIHESIATWDGTAWSSVVAPAAAAVRSNRLLDVVCLAADDCWGVGSYFYGQLGRTLTQHWDGEAWSVIPSPNSSEDRYNSLTSVSCPAPDDCWAVGTSGSWNSRYQQPLALHWDGAAWSLSDPIPVPVHRVTKAIDENGGSVDVIEEASLQSIDCPAANDCWAVGKLETMVTTSASIVPTHSKPFVVHWNGEAWQPMTSLGQELSPMTESILFDVSCLSATECIAVGQQFARFEYNFLEGADARTLIARWDGVAWTSVPSPNVGPHINQLYAVSCIAPECWAVGNYYLDYPYSGSPRQAPLALHMDAAGTWQVADLPTNARPLSGVDCVATDDCWAVGSPPSLESPTKTTTTHWDGTEWTIASSPSKLNNKGEPTANNLRGLACASSTDCWAVGYYAAGPSSQTLTLHYGSKEQGCPGNPGCPSPDPSNTVSPSPSLSESPQPDLTEVAFTINSATAGQYSDETLFEARLEDSNGDPLAGRDLTFELVGTGSPRAFTSTTNDDGVAAVTPTLEEKPGPHQLTVRFVGDDEHAGDAATMSFVIAREDLELELSVHGGGNDKTLMARLSDLDTSSAGIMGRTIDFFSDEELIGSEVTDGDGVASVAVPPTHRGNNRTYEAVFEGDDFYLGASDDQPGSGGGKGSGESGNQGASASYGGKVLLM